MKYILYIIFVNVCLSCTDLNRSDDISDDSNVLVLDFDKVALKDTLHVSSFVAKVTAIILETTDDILIGCLSGMQVTNDCICILDNGFGGRGNCGVFVFDKNGKYLRNIGRKGQGPGEYASIRDFTIDEKNDKIFLVDDDSNKIRIYQFSTGQFIRDINFNNEKVQYKHIQYNNNKLFMDFTYFGRTEKGPMIYVLNETTGKIESTCLDIDIHNHGWLESFFKSESYFYCKNSDNPKYTHFFMNTVMVVKNGKLEPYLKIKSKDWVTKKDVINNKNTTKNIEEDALFKIEKLPIAFKIQNYVESDNYIYFLYKKNERDITVIYDKKRNNLLRTKGLIDDIMFGNSNRETRLIGCGDENGMYGYINTIEMPSYYKYNIENKLSTLNPEFRTLFENKVTSESNPVILYYEYKK